MSGIDFAGKGLLSPDDGMLGSREGWLCSGDVLQPALGGPVSVNLLDTAQGLAVQFQSTGGVGRRECHARCKMGNVKTGKGSNQGLQHMHTPFEICKS